MARLSEDDVLEFVETVPRGRVVTYGDIGDHLGDRGPRAVARALSQHGGAVPWWRVVRADGSCAEPVRTRQLEHLRSEGVPFRGDRVDLTAARWDGFSPA
ncbi:MGMT family protein [Jatrophihabitans sp. YIM 134969]